MQNRAPVSGISLSGEDAALVKGMLARGDRQHDIAAWFGVNGGRIGEIASGQRFPEVEGAPTQLLPPRGPYLAGREAALLVSAIAEIRNTLDHAEALIRSGGSRWRG